MKDSPGIKHFIVAAVLGLFIGSLLMLLLQLGDMPSDHPSVSHKKDAPVAPGIRSVPPQEESVKQNSSFRQGPEVNGADISVLRTKNLLFPLRGLNIRGTKDSFNDARSGHIHEAIDIVAPRNTHVVAVEDGVIAKLWYSKYGGNTIYQFDPTKTYAYYYAHLERYADGLNDGDSVKRGQLIGYVGTSGNAPPNTPHLHFTIFKLTEQKLWYKGSAINPFLVYTEMQ